MEYMTVQEAAKCWGYSETTVRKWCQERKIVFTQYPEKIANRWRIPKDAPCPKSMKKEVK